jgi:monoamine oxidase
LHSSFGAHSSGVFLILDRFDYFNDWIAPDLNANLELNCTVADIDWSVTPVELSCADGRLWTAKHVIITTSIKVLQENDITFSPELPETTRNAIDEYVMLDGLKVFMTFNKSFYKESWEIASNYTFAESSRYFYSAAYGQKTNDNVLGMIAVGEPAAPYLDMSDDAVIESILAELDDVYEGQATPNYIEGYVQNWNRQIFVRGAYTYLFDDDGSYAAVPILREPLEDKLFFAGEAVPANDLQNGFAHGAALSGRAAAAKIAQLLSPSTETSRKDEPGSSGGSSKSSASLLHAVNEIFLTSALFVLLAWF